MIYGSNDEAFSEFEAVRNLLHSTDPTFPPFLAKASRHNDVYRVRHASDEVGEDKVFRAPLESLHHDMVEAGFWMVAHYASDGGYERLYSDHHNGGALTTFVRVTERGDDAVACTIVSSLTARYTRWREMVQKYAQELPVTRGSMVYVIARGRMGGYELKHCGYERSELIESNYTEGVAHALRSSAVDLAEKEPPGRLLLLDGPPGTGKTRAVRALIASLQDKARVVLVPAHLVADLAGPDLLGTLLDGYGKPTVLVIEDADYAMLDREERSAGDRIGATGALSSILNLSDGIVGAQVDLRLIATTNASVDHLDAAVRRPGRLLRRVEFGPLDEQAVMRVVRRELGPDWRGPEPMTTEPDRFMGMTRGSRTLAEVYAMVADVRRRTVT